MKNVKTMTTAAGAPIPENQHSLTAGPRGPVLLQDMHLLEKLAHFARERIPERVVHAKGSGAYGTLTITHDITRFDGNAGRLDNYEPNSFGGPTQNPSFAEPPLPLDGAAGRFDAHQGNDDFSQAGDLYRLLSPSEQDRLTTNLANAMKGVEPEILHPNIQHFLKCDAEYGAAIARKVGIKI